MPTPSDDPSIGYGSEFWLDNSSGTLVELAGVFNFGLPDEKPERVEATHYKSPGKRKQYIDGLKESGSFTVEMNYAPGSPTDVLIRQAKDTGAEREFKQVLPDADGNEWLITGKCKVTGYERTNPNGERRTATMTVELTDDVAEAAAS